MSNGDVEHDHGDREHDKASNGHHVSVGEWMNLEESHLPHSSASPFLPRLVGHIGIT